MGWVERAEELLYDGESVQRAVRVGDGGVAVTSHRVLAFTPDRDGANFRQVDRPNVDGVEVRTGGQFRFLMQAVKAILIGAILVAAGMTLSFDDLVGNVSLDAGGGAASAVGLGQIMGLLETMLTLFTLLDDLLLLFGGLALALGAAVLAVYLWSRETLLVISVAGGEDIELTAPEEDREGVVDRVTAAVVPGDPTPTGEARA